MGLQKNHRAGMGLISLMLLTGCAGIAPDGEQKPSAQQETTAQPGMMENSVGTDSMEPMADLVKGLSHRLLHTEKGTDWKPDTVQAREIQRHKPELSALMEDANWILALAAALEGPLPEDVKQELRRLHESYAGGESHDSITAQVNDLLPKVKDERLRREMKKLANRSWDRDRRAAKTETQTPATPTPPTASNPVKPDSESTAVSHPAFSDSSLKETKDRIDSLTAQGQYLEALRVLETVEDQAGADWVKNRRQSLGNRYCEERRNAAALSFIAARRTSNDSARTQYLRQSLSTLDSCLFQFPDAPVAAKVRRNRALVDKELSR